MTRDDVIRMAREAGMLAPQYRDHIEQLERFAALVAAAEREACVELCETHRFKSLGLASAIRARTTP